MPFNLLDLGKACPLQQGRDLLFHAFAQRSGRLKESLQPAVNALLSPNEVQKVERAGGPECSPDLPQGELLLAT